MKQASDQKTNTTMAPAWPFSLALIIAAVPVLGCLFAYSYQAGYASGFGIPIDLIRLNTLDVLRTWVPVAAVAGMIIALGPFLLLFLPATALPLATRAAPWLLAIGTIAAYLTIVSAGWRTWTILTGIIVVLLIAQSILSRLGKKSKSPTGYSPRLIDQLLSIIGAPWIWAIAIVIVLTIGTFLMGWSYAKERSEFMVLGDPPNIVVLSVYDGLAVTAPYHMVGPGHGEVEQVFTLYRLDALPDQPVRNLTIGPLSSVAK